MYKVGQKIPVHMRYTSFITRDEDYEGDVLKVTPKRVTLRIVTKRSAVVRTFDRKSGVQYPKPKKSGTMTIYSIPPEEKP